MCFRYAVVVAPVVVLKIPTRNEICCHKDPLKYYFERYKIKQNNKISHEYYPSECASVSLKLNSEKLVLSLFQVNHVQSDL